MFGATFENYPYGNTGELIYINPNAGFGIGSIKAGAAANTEWSSDKRQLIIDQTFSREAIYLNKNWSVDGVTPFKFDSGFDGTDQTQPFHQYDPARLHQIARVDY